jgi:hypothetical protein
MKRHKQEINIAWKKTRTLQREKQEDDLDLKNKMTKYMANASFYRLRFRTIDWLTKKIVGGQPLIWWLVFDIVGCWLLILLADYWYCWLAKTSLLTLEFEPFVPWKLWAIVLAFQQKKPELIWTSRTQDMSWKRNSVWAAGQIPTSPLLLRFELENSIIES